MATRGRPTAAPDGQHRLAALPVPLLRSRDLSGTRSRAISPIPYARHLLALRELVATIDRPVWAARRTAAALDGFDGYSLEPPFHLLVLRDRNVVRLGHVIHTTRAMSSLDTVVVDGVPATSATRTIIDLAASESIERLTACVDSALRDRLTSEDFLHRRLLLDGYLPLQFSYVQVVEQPEYCIANVREALGLA